MEVGYGIDGEPCGHGSSHAGGYGDLAGDPAGHRSADASSRFCRVPVPREPVGLGMGHVVDLGTTGSGARIARTRGGTRRSSLGHRRVAGTAAPFVPVVVRSEEHTSELQSRPHLVCRLLLEKKKSLATPPSARERSYATTSR